MTGAAMRDPDPSAGALPQRLGAGVIVALAALRATISAEPMPWFATDPFSPMTIPMTGPGPAGMLLLDVLTVLAAALVLLGEARARRPIGWLPLAALLVGAGAVLWHALPGPDLENLRLGATWIAAMTGAFALSCAARDAGTRRLALGVVVGVVALLAAKGVLEYTVEHDRAVANFQANRDVILESRGWSEDSTMARAFERRLSQREASGWFGLTNVYATVVAGSLVSLLALAIAGWRETRRERPALAAGWPGVVALGALAAGAALVMSQSRGGLLAAVIGLAAIAGGAIARRRPQLRRLCAPAALALVPLALGLVALQGALGPRVAETSLLFRWFYIKTAGVIFGAEPLAGVGPSGFQVAYQFHKPAISPEDVSDPHNLLLAFAAALGIGGLAWCALWLLWLWRAGRELGTPEVGAAAATEPDQPRSGRPPVPPARPELWFIMLACAGPTLIGAWFEQPAMTPEAALVRVVGLVAWVGVAWGVVVVGQSAGWLGLAAAAGAIAAAAQSMIDMAGTFQSSACLVMALLGVAAVAPPAAGGAHEGPEGSGGRLSGVVGGALVGALCVTLAAGGVLPAWRWERQVVAAGQEAFVAARITQRVNEAISPQPPEPPESALQDLAQAVGRAPARDLTELDHQMTLLLLAQAERAAERLKQAAAALDGVHGPTHHALSQTLMRIAAGRRRLGQQELAAAAAAGAEQMALVSAAATGAASDWQWLAVVREGAADLLGDPQMRLSAIEALERAAALNPHSAALAYRLFEAHDAARQTAEAARWAQRAVELDDLAWLDPEGAGLTEAQRERVQRAAGPP